jgi:hypothetical protein
MRLTAATLIGLGIAARRRCSAQRHSVADNVWDHMLSVVARQRKKVAKKELVNKRWQTNSAWRCSGAALEKKAMSLRTTSGSVSGNPLSKVFAAAWTSGKHRGQLKDIKSGLMAAGNMLVRIGLADPDQKSAFGVRPNEHLQGIKRPKRRLTSRKENAGIDDKNDLDAVCYPRIGGVRLDYKAGGYVLDVLGALGLVRYASNGDEVVTPGLRKRIAESGLTDNKDNAVWL